ncbi:MAPEG family protein [Luteimonas sp. FCS-9]|uniref:MAPEG family protein n=1 Tax=Luteimonas sp. FCS-9 TaxID=1547516 RepID=UPI00063EAB4C|nr:MAPEG family protein [Luteimonas sp. FCS-9]KLJ01762.1 membrane protein [Luteimonas sp. FCS-9]
MATELQMLTGSIVLGLVHVLVAAGFSTAQRGMAWNAGNRDGAVPPLTGAAQRLSAASRNFLETFPFFAAAALAVVLTDRGDAATSLGAQLYLWARVAYLPVYGIGIPYLRSAIWAVATVGLVMVVAGLF